MTDLMKSYADMPSEVLIDAAQEKYSGGEKGISLDFERINKRYKDQLNQLTMNQAKIVGLGIVIWIGIIAVVYILGWSAGCVIRGFKLE